jgi:hypothetical protein
MPKTDFENGTIVEPGFLDLLFNHVHDGVDSDGHVTKINLDNAAHVSGSLPLSNLILSPKFLIGGKIYSGAAANEVTVESCYCKADNNSSVIIPFNATMSKKIIPGVDFQTGSGNSGMPSDIPLTVGMKNLFVFLLYKPEIGVDIGFDSALNAANLLSHSPYNYYRRISSVAISATDGSIYPFIHFNDRYLYKITDDIERGPIKTFVDADFDLQSSVYRAWGPSWAPALSDNSIELIYDIFPTTNNSVSVRVLPNSICGSGSYGRYLLDSSYWMTNNLSGNKTIYPARYFIDSASTSMLVETSALPGSISYMVRGFIDRRGQ